MKKINISESQFRFIFNEGKYSDSMYDGVQEIIYTVIDTYDDDGSLWDTEYILLSLECFSGRYDNLNERSSDDDLEYYIDSSCSDLVRERSGKKIGDKEYKNSDGETIIETTYYLNCNDSSDYDFRSTDDIDKYLSKAFGITYNPYSCGFILMNGDMLNLGGNSGTRIIDHSAVSNSLDISIMDMVNMGYIRVSPESPGFQCFKMPNDSQYYTLRDIIRVFLSNDDMYVDLSSSDGVVYRKGTRPDKVMSDIIHYFKDGIRPN